MRRSLLCLVVSFMLLPAAVTSVWAALSIESYHIDLDSLMNPDAYWHENVSFRAFDPLGAGNITDMSITDPGGNLHTAPGGPGEQWQVTDEGGGVVSVWWSRAIGTPPAVGPYEIKVRNAQGEEAVLVTAPTTHLPEPVPNITYPVRDSVIPETTPLFTWDPYPGFTCEPGAPAASGQWLYVDDGRTIIWDIALPPEVTSALYGSGPNPPLRPLEPGHTYHVLLWEWGEPIALPDGIGTYSENTAHGFDFTVYSAVPVIQRVDIYRVYQVLENGSGEWANEVYARVSDGDGVDDIVSLRVLDPEGHEHPRAGDWLEQYDQGSYVRVFYWGEWGQRENLQAGFFEVTVEDASGHWDRVVTDLVVPGPDRVPEVVYPPRDGLVHETVPAIAWEAYEPGEGMPLPAAYNLELRRDGMPLWQIWLPDETTSVRYNCDGSASEIELLPGSTYQLQLGAWSEELEQSDPRVHVVTIADGYQSFTVYSAVPVIQRVSVDRGRDVQVDGSITYHERVHISAVDCDGVDHIASVVVTDSEGVDHSAGPVATPSPYSGEWEWNEWGTAAPPPPGPYAVTVTDKSGRWDSVVTAEAPAVREASPTLLTPPPNNSLVYETAPTFSWINAIPGSSDNLHIWDQATGQEVWYYGTNTETSVVYGAGGNPPNAAPLVPGHTYGWQIDEWMCEDCGESDPRVTLQTSPHSYGRFTVGWAFPTGIGTGIAVSVDDLTITFETVSAAGETHLGLDDSPPGLPSLYFPISDCYQASTTASYSGPVTICVSYRDADLLGVGPEASLVLLRYDQGTGQWQDITTSRDPEANKVCGQADSLGIFRLAVPWEPVPIEGKLLVSSWAQVYLMEVNSDNIVHAPLAWSDGALSPRGDKVAYDVVAWVPYIHLSGDVWVSGIDGTDPTNLTGRAGLSGINCGPLWSPDGTMVAFAHCDPAPGRYPCEVGFHAWVMNADGSGAHRVTAEGTPPTWVTSWSPDGYRLLCDVEGVGAVAIDVDGTDQQLIPNVAGGVWSPDGSKIACGWTVEDVVEGERGHWRQLGVTQADGSNPQVLVEQFVADAAINTHLGLGYVANPHDAFFDVLWWVGPHSQCWSPRGDRIAFVAALPFDPHGRCFYDQNEVWMYQLDTASLRRLTSDAYVDATLSWRADNTAPEEPTVTIGNTTVSFETVASGGLTTILRTDEPPGPEPSGFQFLGEYYDIKTTATISGKITIQIRYNDADVPGGQEQWLSLLHWEGGRWVDITVRPIDTENNIITGECTSLSEFALVVPTVRPDWMPPLHNGTSVTSPDGPFKRGRTIPVKFRLRDAAGQLVSDAVAQTMVAQLQVFYEQPSAQGTPIDPGDAPPDIGGEFRYDSAEDQFIYNLSTKDPAWLANYTYGLDLLVNGIKAGEVFLSLR
jgi:hypothetical protein